MQCCSEMCSSPTITNGGVTIAREIELEDHLNMGARLVKEVATGPMMWSDGTTTAVLAQAAVREPEERGRWSKSMFLKRGIELAVNAVVDRIKVAKPVDKSAILGSIDYSDRDWRLDCRRHGKSG